MGILGIEPTWEGLSVRPALPPHWDRASIRRPYRGDVLHIEIINEAGGAPSDALVVVDGHALAPGECITASGEGIERRVRVRLVPRSR
jgi:cellobiose phosphorylase